MDNDKIILDMLNRICTLEEQVKLLAERMDTEKGAIVGNVEKAGAQVKMSTGKIKNYILELKELAKERGERDIRLTANNVHRDLKLKNRMPMVCNAMRQAMRENDEIVHQTESGYSSTFTVRYFLDLK